MANLDTKKLIIGIVILAVLIVGGSYLYTKTVSKNQPVPVSPVTQTPSVAQSSPKPESSPNTITQDVKNPALQGLASATATNTLTVTIFVDTNSNGKKEVRESNYNGSVEVAYGIPGKTSNAYTNTSGQVVFKNVDAGTFTVYFPNPPKGYTATTPLTVKDVKIPPSANVEFGIKSITPG